MIDVGQITVGPTTANVKIGDLDLADGQNAIWLRTTQISPNTVWRYAYGLVYWKSTDGRELGTCKVYSHSESETTLLTVHRAPDTSEGALFFTPRSYNRLWINAHKDIEWTLKFEVEVGTFNANAGGAVAAAISNNFANADGSSIIQKEEPDFIILGNN